MDQKINKLMSELQAALKSASARECQLKRLNLLLWSGVIGQTIILVGVLFI